MALSEHLVHERMLGGAIDSYISFLNHVQPYVAERYEAQLENLAEQWFAQGRENQLAALNGAWLQAYLAKAENAKEATEIIQKFLTWTIGQKLITTNPLITR